VSNLSYVAGLHTKTGVRLSHRAVKRAALGLAIALGAAGAAEFGYGYLTTGRYLESTDDAYVKADSTIISPKVSGYTRKCWSAITSR
jgi:membrane fusion protein (multidrug efflux system)